MSREILIERINTTEGFKNLRDAWISLIEKNPSVSIFLSWEWLYAWWETYKSTRELWLITARTEEELIGIAPLMLDKRGTGAFKLRFLCNIGNTGNNSSIPSTDVGGLIINNNDSQVIRAIFEYLAQHKSEWDILELNEIFQESEELKGLTQIFTSRQFKILEEIKKHYYIPLKSNWESFFTSLSGKFRHNLRRAGRLASESGNVLFAHQCGSNVNWSLFEKIIEVNQYSHHPLLYKSITQQAFIKRLVELMADRKWFTVYLLSIDDKPVAYEYGFVHAGRFEDWRAGYDTRINPSISIGKLLSMKVAENCITNGDAEIDMLRGDESYKTEWHPEERNFINTRVFRVNNLPAMLAYLWLNKIKPLIKRGRN